MSPLPLPGPAAFLACFPAPPPAKAPKGLPPAFAAGFADPPDAAELRAERQLDAKSTLDMLKKLPTLAGTVGIAIRLRPFLSLLWSRLLLLNVPEIFIFLLVYPFNNGMFATRGLAVATVAFVLQAAWWTWTFYGNLDFYGALADRSLKPNDLENGATEVQNPSEAPNEAGVLAGAVRYQQLVQSLRAEDASQSTMLEHDPTNVDLCPCVECTQSVLRWGAILVTLFSAFFSIFGLLAFVLFKNWTSLVTLGPFVWRTPWSAILLGLALTAMTVYVFAATFLPVLTFSGPLLDLELRLRMRALSMALDDLNERLRHALRDADPVELPSITSSQYIALHASLLSEWSDDFIFSRATGRLTRSLFLSDCAAILLNAAGASCVPASYLFSIGVNLCLTGATMLNTASVNRQCDAAAAAYRGAVLDLTALADEAALAPSAVQASIRSHRSLLKRFAQLDGARARFLGFPITGDVIRALATTVVSLAVALWSVFRSLSVGITIQTVCPVVE
ncbi:hypothetical protein DFJ74DRAFT_518681 [Hyaloraphidium curvatum]|nr:hypothetical protein DFJ74DRAFT_518681 [Hyaloraphidium curvatum]